MDNKDLLKLIPVQKCESEKNGDVITVLYYKEPNFIEKKFFKKLAAKPLKADLDEIGSFIWPLIDGKNSVENIVKKGNEEFGEKIEPAEERICLFIRQLNQNKFIQLFQKIDDGPDEN